jgi:hypothetical protein
VTAGAREYIVTVWIEPVMVQDETEPDVYGRIELTSAEYYLLDEQLNALHDEEFIEEYSIREVEVPALLTPNDILMGIVAARDTEEAQEAAAIWHNIQLVTD